MALYSIKKIDKDTSLGLWKIEESVDDLMKKYPFLVDETATIEKFGYEGRKVEYLSVRALLYEMTQDTQLRIRYNRVGKPQVYGRHISISHTKGWATVILSESKEVGVDIEYRSDRVDHVAKQFLRPDEEAPTTENRQVIWGVKETIYKLFSDDDLKFSEMRAFQIKDGYCMVINFRRYLSVPVKYEVNEDFVLTYAFLDAPDPSGAE